MHTSTYSVYKTLIFFEGGDAVRGRYSHVAAVMEGRVLLVAGGYSGVARGDLVAYKVPLFVSSDQGDRVSEGVTMLENENMKSYHWEDWQIDPTCIKTEKCAEQE